ncbi:hypothetical protein DL98DRAFT_462809 [Cadophora sp. DSE1049]|nr:hypothetical protein DL98DRAFT_462809 [Cadophora sp. DSE1049]
MASTSTTDTANLPHDTLQPQALTITFFFPAIATVALALRYYSRSLTRTFASDDWVIGIAAVLYWANTFTSYKVIIINYVGYHVWDIPTDFNLTLGLKWGYATELLYNPILAIVKTSILLFLWRLTGQKIAVRRTILGLLIFNNVAMLLTFLITVFNCVPIAASWAPASYPNRKCMNFADFVTGTASVAVLTDVLVLLLPTWIVYDLQIPKKQKIMLIGILSFGFVTVIMGIIRVVLLDGYDRHMPIDFNYSVYFCLSTIEIGLSFVAACAPAMKPIIMRLLPKFFGSTRSGTGKYGAKSRFTHGYQMDAMSRKTATHVGMQSQAKIEGGEYDDAFPIQRVGVGTKGIVCTTETEVKWVEAGKEREAKVKGTRGGSSTESLV